jgi:hypothetical protein
MSEINDIVPIVPTPFTIEDEIDWPSLRRLVDFDSATGACAMCLPAYTNEFYKLYESEGFELMAEAVRQPAGRLPVLAQVNFVSRPQAVETAREVERLGASAIGAALPRMFAFGEPDLWRYFDRLLSSIDIPLMIQDVNLATHNDLVGAYQVHEGALPQISFSLQHIELFHHTEERLLVARGILPGAAVRPLPLQLDRHTEDRIAFLNGRILALVDQLDLPRHPSLLPSHEGVLEA